jgi:hypothetical protein
LVHRILAIETHVRGYLIIPAAGRVEPGTCRSDAARQIGLNVHVHVLEAGLELKVSVLDLVLDLFQSTLNGSAFLSGDDARFFQALRMSDGSPDIMGIEAPVE